MDYNEVTDSDPDLPSPTRRTFSTLSSTTSILRVVTPDLILFRT